MLGRRGQVITFQLRTDHNRLAHHLYKTFLIRDSEGCPCGEGKRNAAHVLQDCPKFCAECQKYWPTQKTVQEKLSCQLEGLQATAAFIQAMGLDIWRGKREDEEEEEEEDSISWHFFYDFHNNHSWQGQWLIFIRVSIVFTCEFRQDRFCNTEVV